MIRKCFLHLLLLGVRDRDPNVNDDEERFEHENPRSFTEMSTPEPIREMIEESQARGRRRMQEAGDNNNNDDNLNSNNNNNNNDDNNNNINNNMT